VFVRNWQAWKKLGVRAVSCPGSYWHSMRLDVPVSVGGFACAKDPAEPIVVNLSRVPCAPGLPARDQHRAGRQELLDTPFEHMEQTIRQQMARVLGPGGFDPAQDIKAITVNRWPHGYAYEYNPLWDPDWPAGQAPCEIGRKPFGRITIANSDAAAAAYTDQAMDQAYRAVDELIAAKAS
jgi:spermidine dehydrogenase